jgi:signal transduction histidine kinase
LTFARRLLVGTVLVLLATIGVLVVSAERWLRTDLEGNLATALQHHARILRLALPADSLAWTGFARRYAEAGALRITIMDSTGRVRADSDVRDEELSGVENHAGRPEVAAALTGQIGTARRRSATTSSEFLYLAAPGGPGVLRVAMPLDQVDDTVWAAQRSVLLAAVLAIGLGSILAWLAGRSITKPLTETALAARAIASGTPPTFPRSGIPDMDAMVGAMRGMYEELESRFDALRRKQAETEALVNAMVEGVLSSDARGQVVTANPAARRLLGYGSEARLPALQVLFHHKAARAAVEASLRGETVPDREVIIDERTCLLSARPLPQGGAVLVLHDLTDLRRLETIRRDFVANVSHELKTPLTSISGYAETLLADRSDDAMTRRFLETILANARRMQSLVDDQLDLSRIESGGWKPASRMVLIEPILREAWTAVGSTTAASLGFRVLISPGTERVYADPEAVRQVFLNLFDNARRYTPSGGEVTVTVSRDGTGTLISVRDSGTGIPGEHLPRIFERFYRADPSRSRAEGGTGLGLAIVKHLVEAHGGKVWAESELGIGTTIYCWFPGSQ